MSFLRKMYAQVRLDSDAVAADGDAYIVRAGCRVTSTATTYILTDNPGGLRESLFCYAVDSSGDKITNSDFQINAGSLNQGVLYSESDGAFKITFSTNPPAEAPSASWARIVCNPAYTTSFVEFYQTDTAADTPLTAKIDLPATGKIEGYVKVRDVDVVVDYNANRTHIFDVSTEAREFVTPEDFGAIGDGTTDDARYIQNALDYLSFVTSGGELRLGPKTYLCKISTLESVTDGLKIRGDNVRVVGQGFGSVIKQGINATDLVGNSINDMFLVQDGVTGCVFQDFQIDDSTAGTSDGSTSLTKACIKAGDNSAQTASLRISGLKIRSFNKTAIYLYGCDGFTIINTVVGNNGGQIGGHGIYIGDGTSTVSKRGIISSCQLYDNGSQSGNGAAGVFMNVADRVMIDGCSIRGWDYGVKFADGDDSQDITIDSCHIRDQNNVGIYTSSGNLIERLLVSGNTIDTTGDQGIYLDSTSAIISAVINGNSVMSTGKSGMVFDSLLYSTVANNVIRDWNTADDVTASAAARFANQAGIGIDAVCTGTSFVGNKCFGVSIGTSYGFYYATGTADIESIGNSIVGSVTGDHYFETPANASSNSWFNQDFTTKSWYWGDPDGTVGILKTDGSIDMGGGQLDTEGGDILVGGGDVNTEGGNVEIGDGQLINATGSNGWVNLGTHYDDMLVPLTQATLSPAAGITQPTVVQFKTNGAGSAGVFAFSFDAASEEELLFSAQIPHGYIEGTDLLAHVHWAPSSTNTGNVVWGLEYTIQNVNGTFGNTTLIEATVAAEGTADKHQADSIGTISGTSLNVSAVLVGRLYRKAADAADTFTGEARALSLDFHIQKNSIGSDAEFTKA